MLSTAIGTFQMDTLRLLTEQSDKVLGRRISASTVGGILRRHKLQPHRSKYWCRAPGPDADPDKLRRWGEAMECVLGGYMRPDGPATR